MKKLHDLSIVEAAQAMGSGNLSSVELTEALLERIDDFDSALKVFVRLAADHALNAAAMADAQRDKGDVASPLHGIPLGIKDIFDTKGIETSSCSRMRAGQIPEEDAISVARLVAAGGIVLGKANTHEFAFGFETPPTRNPWDQARTPSGSSGGCAAGLAAGFFPGATGSDTVGSIRAPASACGVSGIKPTYGRVSKQGVAALSWITLVRWRGPLQTWQSCLR